MATGGEIPVAFQDDGIECRLSQSYTESCDDGLTTNSTTWKDYTLDHQPRPSLHLTLDDLRNGKIHKKAISITTTEATAQFAKPASIRSETTINSSTLSLSDVGQSGSRAASFIDHDCTHSAGLPEGWSDSLISAPGQLVAGLWGLATWATGYGVVDGDSGKSASPLPSAALDAMRHAYMLANTQRPRNFSAPTTPAANLQQRTLKPAARRPTSQYRLDDAKLHPFPALVACRLYDVNGEPLPALRSIPVRTQSMQCSTPSPLFHEGSLPHRTIRLHSSGSLRINATKPDHVTTTMTSSTTT
jgi:hypothetical protein